MLSQPVARKSGEKRKQILKLPFHCSITLNRPGGGILPKAGFCLCCAETVKPCFHMVVSGLLRSLLNLKFRQKLSTTIWKHE